MSQDENLFHVMKNMRPMRRLKPNPISDALIEEILDAASCAPNSLNSQPYRFLLIRDATQKGWFGKQYDAAMWDRFAAMSPKDGDDSKNARNVRTAMQMGKHIKDIPLLLLVCGVRDWPFSVQEKDRVGLAPASLGSVYPCIQNILLACRAKGLGASLTTMHQVFEENLCSRLGIPADFGVVGVIPIGYPIGSFGPVSRLPARDLTFYETWSEKSSAC